MDLQYDFNNLLADRVGDHGISDAQIKALEARRQEFTASVESLGLFSALDVPSRVGPTWSRRSGG